MFPELGSVRRRLLHVGLFSDAGRIGGLPIQLLNYSISTFEMIMLLRQLNTSILSFRRKSRYICGIFDRNPGGYWMPDQVRHDGADGASLFSRQVNMRGGDFQRLPCVTVPPNNICFHGQFALVLPNGQPAPLVQDLFFLRVFS